MKEGNNLALLLDVIVIVIIISLILTARRKGFLSSVVKLIGSLISLAVAMYYCSPLANWVYRVFLEKRILEAVSDNIGELSAQSLEAFAIGLESTFNSLPAFIGQLLQSSSAGALENWYEAFLYSDTISRAAAMTNSVIAPIVISLLKAIVFCVIFGVLSMAVNRLSQVLHTVNAIPVIGGINSLLGGVLGLVQGMLYVFVLAAVVWILISVTGDSLSFITNKIINDSHLFKYFYNAGPWVDGMMRLL